MRLLKRSALRRVAEVGVADTVTKLRKLRRQGHFRKQDPDPGILGEDESNEITDLVVEMTIKMMDEGQKTIFWPRHVEHYIGVAAREEISPMGWKESVAEVAAQLGQVQKGRQ